MVTKKLFCLFSILLVVNAFASSYADSSIEGPKKEIEEKEKPANRLFVKLIKKEPLTEQEELFLEACRNYSLGTVGGLTCFYLVPPIGFGVISALLAKSLFAVAGGIGIVELFKTFTIDEIKQKLEELFAQKEAVVEKIEEATQS